MTTTVEHEVFTLHRGRTPLLVSVPHTGTALPDEVKAALVPRAHDTEDADWHLDRLYAFVHDELGASLLVPRHARYVIDLNRPPDDTPMYAGVNNTELCPTRFFTGEPLYREGRAPDAAAIDRRRARYWQPYHDALAAELARLRVEHGHALLYDGHSIKAELPWLFEGRLPDLNLGTANGASCAPSLRAALAATLAAQGRYTHVVDGRFKGGHITRRYGCPHDGVHAVQMEMGWHTYLDDRERLPRWDEARANDVRSVLRSLLEAMIAWRPA